MLIFSILLLCSFVSQRFCVLYQNISETIENLTRKGYNDSSCMAQLRIASKAVTDKEAWALKLYDSTGKLPSGLLSGNIVSVGNYEECLGVNVTKHGEHIEGKYCTVTIEPDDNRTSPAQIRELMQIVGINPNASVFKNIYQPKVSVDVCVPKVCTIEETQELLNDVFENKFLPVRLLLSQSRCLTTEKKQLSIIVFVSVGIAIFLIIITVASTAYDILVYQRNKDLVQKDDTAFLIAFSWYTNIRRLFSFRTREGTVACLNGIRVLSMMWILLAHRCLINAMFPNVNWLYLLDWEKKLENTFFHGAIFSVDTFFLISGLLTVYVYFVLRDIGLSMNIFYFYLHRLLRLLPSLSAALLLYLCINDIGSGPFWPQIKVLYYGSCEKYWWTTLLFIQNYYNPTEMCMWQTWFLAVDTHLYLTVPIITALYYRSAKITVFLTAVFVCLSLTLAALNTWKYEAKVTFLGFSPAYLKYLYFPTHIRMSPFLIGTAIGYLLYRQKNKEVNIPKALVIFLWTASVGIMLAVVLVRLDLAINGTTIKYITYNTLATLAWCMALCCIIFCCVTGYGAYPSLLVQSMQSYAILKEYSSYELLSVTVLFGLRIVVGLSFFAYFVGYINTFLSLPIFHVLIRLNYSVYLLHLCVISISLINKRSPGEISNLQTIYQFWSDYVYCLLLSVIWTLTFESPITVLEKRLLGKYKFQTDYGERPKKFKV